MKRFLAALALAAFAAAGTASAAERLVIAGSTTVLPIAQAEIEKFMEAHPDVEISLSGSGSGDGIKALIDGTAHIANSSRFIKDSEVKAAVEGGAYPVPFAIAMDALIPVVHPSNPVEDLTIDQLRKIYSGEITNWSQVGGQDSPIAVVGRDTSSGTYEVWEEKVMEGARVSPRTLVVASNGAMVQAVAKNPLAIGYIGVGYQSGETKSLKVEAIVGSAETVRNQSYPIARALFMFTRGWPKGGVLELINFINSDDGQALVEQSGFIPMR